MKFETNINLNLEKNQDVLNFLIDRTLNEYILETPDHKGYTHDPKFNRLSKESYETILYTSKEKIYKLFESGQSSIELETVTLLSPVIHKVFIRVCNQIFIHKSIHDLDKINKLKSEFENYVYNITSTDEPNIHLSKLLNELGIDEDLVIINTTFVIQRNGSSRDDVDYNLKLWKSIFPSAYGELSVLSELRNKFPEVTKESDCNVGELNIFKSDLAKGEDNLINTKMCLEDYFFKRGIRFDEVTRNASTSEPYFPKELPIYPFKESDEIEGKIDEPKSIIDDTIRHEFDSLPCKFYGIDPIYERVCTILIFPEFMIFWENVTIDLDCFKITLKLPIMKVRLCDKALYYHIHYKRIEEMDEQLVFFNCIKICALSSAIKSGVLSLLLLNPGAAVPIFKQAFIECMKKHYERYLECILPGLTLIKEPRSSWHSLY